MTFERWLVLQKLYNDYASSLDDGPLSDWPDFFTEKCLYLIQPRDNYDAGLPMAVVRCESRGMLQDRVNAVQETIMFEPRYLRHHITNIEADDALGLKQDSDTMICSIDKDLLMCEGNHYNFVKKEFKQVTKEEGTRFFYQQMITGDSADNILGIRGLGKVKASKLLKDTARKNWDNMIIDLYIKEFGYEEGRNRCVQNSQLLWILQSNKQMPMDFSYEQVQK